MSDNSDTGPWSLKELQIYIYQHLDPDQDGDYNTERVATECVRNAEHGQAIWQCIDTPTVGVDLKEMFGITYEGLRRAVLRIERQQRDPAWQIHGPHAERLLVERSAYVLDNPLYATTAEVEAWDWENLEAKNQQGPILVKIISGLDRETVDALFAYIIDTSRETLHADVTTVVRTLPEEPTAYPGKTPEISRAVNLAGRLSLCWYHARRSYWTDLPGHCDPGHRHGPERSSGDMNKLLHIMSVAIKVAKW